jgi:hypothetical protein
MAKTNTRTNPTTAKAVNDALRARGRDESLRKGDGYFYFGGEAVNWFSTGVQVRRLSDMTVKQWLQEFDRLMAREKQFRKGVAPKKRKS